MSESLTPETIRAVCGNVSFARGQSYYNQKRVTRVERDPDGRLFEAVVIGSHRYKVHVQLEGDEVTHATCECPASSSYDGYCKHIAAVLFHIYAMQRGPLATKPEAPTITNEHLFLARSMIGLFDRSPAAPEELDSDARLEEPERLTVEYTCTVVTIGRKPSFTIEMKLGVKRLYVIKKIKDFLKAWDNGTSLEFAKLFTFDPTSQTLSDEDRAVIEELVEVARNENAFRDAFMAYSFSRHSLDERQQYIPPYAWESLLPKLVAAGVRFVHGKEQYDRLRVVNEPVPLSFDFSHPGSDVYRMEVNGLENVTVMEAYGCCLIGDALYPMTQSVVKQLTELKNMFARSDNYQVLVSPTHLELFLARVVPGLKKLGNVDFAAEVSDKIVTAPLQAKLYLDRSGDQLWATLEYAYDDVVFDPLAAKTGKPLRSDRILMRDGEKENRIMSLLEQIPFQYNGKVLHLDDENDIYHFLFHTLPQLERWTEIYATPEAQAMMRQTARPPKLSVELDARTDWLEVSFDVEGIDDADIRDVLKSLVEKKSYYRLPDGRFLSLEDEAFSRIAGLLADMDIRHTEVKDRFLKLSVARGLALLDADDCQDGLKLGRRFREFLDQIRHPDRTDCEVPKELSSVLRDYQKHGYQWMKTLANYRFGGILADDMGLGKTLQGIAYIRSELDSSREAGTPALIVSPASLTYNWQNELKKFAPTIRSVVLAGDKSAREETLGALGKIDVLITSYPLLRRDASELADRRFGVLILDEAQAIKNHATATAQSVQELQAKQRFALTGTPIENKLEELWSIFDAVFPELFGSRRRFLELSPEQVARKTRPFILRRLKSDVLTELPDKIETVQTAELLPEQKKLYLAYLTKLQQDTARRLREDGLHKSRMHILAGMTRLRQLCCHPAMFLESYEGDSAKLEQLLEIVEECRSGGKRMLVFSQFTEMLGLIRRELDRRDVSYFYLDGQTPVKERVDLCARFNEGENELFLISLKAGGTGLNLTGADTVILYDLWWNPAVEQQAADRAHRIGQKNVVQVIRLVTQGTIEEKMYELQQRKRNLIDAVIQPGDENLASMDEEDIRELLMI